MITREDAARLEVCTESHGRADNKADVYGHGSKVCIRLRETDVWVYSPGSWRDKWERS